MKGIVSILKVIGILFLIALVAVGYRSLIHPKLQAQQELAAERDALKAENAEKQRNIAEATRKTTDFQTKSEYPEIIARRDGLAKGSETVYDFSGSK